MEIFKDYVYLGRTATDYINLIEALKKTVQRNTQERIDFAQVILGKIMFKEIYKQFSN
jgi:hypothetical protein